MKWRKYSFSLVLLLIVGGVFGMVLGDEPDEEQTQESGILPEAKPPTPLSIREEGTPDQVKPKQEVIRASRFELVDTKGKVRAVFAMTPADEPRLALADRAGNIQAMLSVEPVPGDLDGIPTLRLFDKAGKMRTDIKLTRDGNPEVVLRNKNGGHLASLTGMSAARGGTEWLLSDDNGVVRVTLTINQAGANLSFLDKDRKMRARFGLKPDESPVLVYNDESGKEHSVLGPTKVKNVKK